MYHSKKSLKERFWVKTQAIKGGCSVWTAGHDGRYGVIGANGTRGWTMKKAHRVAWELANGPIPVGFEVCHHCDNPLCVEIDHLFLDTHLGNFRDAMQKGRVRKGKDHHNARLTEDDVRKIRATHGTMKQIGRDFGVSRQMVGAIKNKTNWKHVN